MMSRHRTGLLRGRYASVTHPAPPPQRTLGAAAATFLSRSETWQAQQLETIDAAAFTVNFHLLQVWDLLSLYLCTGEPKQDLIEPVPVGYESQPALRLRLTPKDESTIAIEPYPFDVKALHVSYVYRLLERATYADEAAFRTAWFGAAPQVRAFTFV